MPSVFFYSVKFAFFFWLSVTNFSCQGQQEDFKLSSKSGTCPLYECGVVSELVSSSYSFSRQVLKVLL